MRARAWEEIADTVFSGLLLHSERPCVVRPLGVGRPLRFEQEAQPA